MANGKVDIDVNLITRQAQANARALERSTLGLAASVTGLLAGVELITRGFAAMGRVFDATIGSSNRLETAIAEVTTLLGDTTGVQEQLTQEILGFQRQFGADAIETTKAYYQAISSGAVDASNAQDLLTAANKLAVGGVTSVATAVDGLTNVINAYGLNADDANEISDTFFTAMRAGKTTVDELANSVGQVAPNAAQLGVSFQEVLASVSAVTTAGVRTSVAMTQLRAVFANLSKPTESLQEALDKAGISSIDLALKQDGLVSTLKRVAATTDGTASAIQSLFGSVEAGSFVLAVTSDTIGNKFNSILKDMQDSAQNAGEVTEEAFRKIAATSEFQLKKLDGQIAAFGTEVGTILKPAFLAITEGLTSLLETALVFFDENKQAVREFALQIGAAIASTVSFISDFGSALIEAKEVLIALGAAVGTVVTIQAGYKLSLLATTVAQKAYVFAITFSTKALLASIPVTTLATGGLAALAAGVVYAYRNFDELSAFIIDLTGYISNKLIPVADFLIDSFTMLCQVTNVVIAGFKLYYATLLDVYRGIASFLMPAIKALLGGLASVAGVFGGEYEDAINSAKDSVENFIISLESKIDKVKEDAKETIKNRGLTEDLEKQNRSLKESYRSNIEALEDYSQKSKELLAEKNQEVVTNAKVERSEKSLKEEVVATTKELDKNTKAETKSVVKKKEKEKALTEAEKAEKAYREQLEKTRKEIDRQEGVTAGLAGAFSVVQEDAELRSISNILGARETAIRVAEAEYLKSVGKKEEAELLLAELSADANRKAQEKVIDDLAKKPPPFVEQFKAMVKEVPPAFEIGVATLRGGANLIRDSFIDGVSFIRGDFFNDVSSFLQGIKDAPVALFDSIKGLADVVIGTESDKGVRAVTALIPEMTQEILQTLPKIVNELADSLPGLVGEIAESLPKLLPELTKTFVKLVRSLAPQVPVLVRAVAREIPTIIRALLQVIPAIVREVPSIITAIVEQIPGVIDAIVDNLPAIVNALVEATPKIVDGIVDNFPAIVKALVAGAIQMTLAFIKLIPTAVVELIRLLPDIVLSFVTEVIRSLPTLILALVDEFTKPGYILSIIEALIEQLPKLVSSLATFLVAELPTIVVKLGIELVKQLPKIAVRLVTELLKEIPRLIEKIANGIADAVKDAIGGVGRALDPTSSDGFLGSVGGAIGGAVTSVGDFLGLAKGGIVGGSSRVSGDNQLNDIVPAMLSPGEMIIPKSYVSDGLRGVLRFAAETLGQQTRRFNSGGLVSTAGRLDYAYARSGVTRSGGANNRVAEEVRQLRFELKSMGFAIANNGKRIEQILDGWDGVGLPSDRGF